MNTKPSALVYLFTPIFTLSMVFAISILMAPMAYADDTVYPVESIALPLYELPVQENKLLKDTKLEFCISKDACENEWTEVVIDVKAGSLEKPLVAKLLMDKKEVGTVKVNLSEAWSGNMLIYQIELDETNNHQEILIVSYTGGAHCCAVYKILAVYDGKITFNHFIMVDGGPGIGMHSDGKLMFNDNRFLYTFGSYADSYTVPRFYDYKQGKVIDVSKQPQYKERYLEEMEYLKPKCGKVEHLPSCAAYAAAAARVGQFDKVWKFINTHYKQDPARYEHHPSFCNIELTGDEPCPDHQQYSFNTFPGTLLQLLKEWDYVEK